MSQQSLALRLRPISLDIIIIIIISQARGNSSIALSYKTHTRVSVRQSWTVQLVLPPFPEFREIVALIDFFALGRSRACAPGVEQKHITL